MRRLYLNGASAHAHAQRLSCAWLFVQSLPGFSVHGISQSRILQWVAIPLPGYLPNPGTELESSMSPVLQAALYLLSHHTQVEEEGIAQKTSSEWLFSRVKLYGLWWSSSVQLFSCVWLCDPMDCSAPGLPVHHQHPELRSDSCPSSWCCHPALSSSVAPFSSCLQSFPASGSLPMNHFFASGDQSFEVSASVSVLPLSIQDWFPLGLNGLISLQSKGLSRVFSNTKVQKHQFFTSLLSLWSDSHIHTWLL